MCYTGEKMVSRHYHGGESQERGVWFLGDEEFKPRNQTLHHFTPNWQVCWHVSSISFSEFSQLPTKTRPDFLQTAEDGLSFQIFVRIFPVFALNISVSSSRSSLPPVDLVQVAYFILKPWRLQFLVLQTPKNLQIMPQADTLDDLAADSSLGYSSAVEPRKIPTPGNFLGCLQ